MPVLVVLSSMAEIGSFWINHQSYILTNFDRLTRQVQIAWNDEPGGSTLQGVDPPSTRGVEPRTMTACTRYTYYTVDPNCEAITEIPKRLLCQISLAPVEKVCAEHAPAG